LVAQYDGIAISGTHGKSTTTAWLTFMLRRAGLDPSFVVGATVAQLGGGSGVGNGPHFIVEACEFDRSFLNLRPRRAAILNIEEDHLDCYDDLAAIRAAFAAFAGNVAADGLIVLNREDAQCATLLGQIAAHVQTYGAADGVTWRATEIALDDGHYSFNVVHEGTVLGRVRLGLAGRHNVDNALAVIALAHDCGVSWGVIETGLAAFRGAHRRLELRGDVNGVRVLDDYAHHPTEVRATLRAARERFNPRQLWCVFQPHQHSRTRFLLKDFARSFVHADRVIVPDIYFVRDSQRERELVCAEDLVREIRGGGGTATFVPRFAAIVDLLARETQPGDVVLTMGAGNIWKVADELVQRLGGHLPD
jgi:UDP-N-acetylmuramate--alanine ligase